MSNLPEEQVRHLEKLAADLFSGDPHRAGQASIELAPFNIVPQNFQPFTQLLQRTVDQFLVQFIVQSLRRIILKYFTHLPTTHITELGLTIVQYINTHIGTSLQTCIVRSTVTTLAQLYGTLLRYFWMAVPELRSSVADVAQMLGLTAHHCYIGALVLSEVIDEISGHRTNSIAANSYIASLQLSRSVTTAFGSTMIPSLMITSCNVLFQLLSAIYKYNISPQYLMSGHQWDKYPLISAPEFDLTTLQPDICRTMIQRLLDLMLKCIRFDFSGLGKQEEDDIITFPTPSQWKPLTSNNFMFLMIIRLAEIYASDEEILNLCIQLITGYLAFKNSAWNNLLDRYIAAKYSVMFVIVLFRYLQEPTAPPYNNAPRFLEHSALFTSTASLLNTLFRVFTLSDIVNAMHPLIHCDLHFNPTLQQEYVQLRGMLNEHFMQNFHPQEFFKQQWNTEKLNIVPPPFDLTNTNPSNNNLDIYNTVECIQQDFTAFTQKNHPCRIFQEKLFLAWIHELYDFSLKVYTTGFPSNAAGTELAANIPLSNLVTSTADLGDVTIYELIDIHQNLLTFWSSLATSYTSLPAAYHQFNIPSDHIESTTKPNAIGHTASISSSSTTTGTGTTTNALSSSSTNSLYTTSNNNGMDNGTNTGNTPSTSSSSSASSSSYLSSTSTTFWPKSSTYAEMHNKLINRRLPPGPRSIAPVLEFDDVEAQVGKLECGDWGDDDDDDMYNNNTATDDNTSQQQQQQQKSTTPLISLQHHIDAVLKRIFDYEQNHAIISQLPKFLPQICTSYIKSLVFAFGALYDGLSLSDVMTNNIETLHDFYFKSQYLSEQFATFASIARTCPESFATFIESLYQILMTSYLNQISLLPKMCQRITYEINNGAYKIIANNNTTTNNNVEINQPYYIYTTLITTLYNQKHQDKGIINFTLDEKNFLITMHRTETQLSIILMLLTILFQPKHNFFNIKFGPHEQPLLIRIHSEWSVMLWQCFRLYTVRYGHYNTYTTPTKYLIQDIISNDAIHSLSLETLLTYLSTTPGLCLQPLDSTRYGLGHDVILYTTSNPLFLSPTSAFFTYSILSCIGAFIDSLVFRQYLSRTQSHITGRSYSDMLLHSTYISLQSVLLALPYESDDTPPSSTSTITSATTNGMAGIDTAITTTNNNTKTICPTHNIFGQPIIAHCSQFFNADNKINNDIISSSSSSTSSSTSCGFNLLPSDSGYTGHITFTTILNTAMFFNIHCLNVYPLKHYANYPILELSMSFLLHITTTMSLSIMLNQLPINRIFIDKYHSLSLARITTPLPLPVSINFALEPLFLKQQQQQQQQQGQQVNKKIPVPLLIYAFPLQANTTSITNTQYRDSRIITYLNDTSSNDGSSNNSTNNLYNYSITEHNFLVSTYYEFISRVTKRQPQTLTMPFDTLFGAIRNVLDNTNKIQQKHDIDLFSNTIVFICTALTGAGGVMSGEHIFQWVARYLSLLSCAGMQCATLLYSDKNNIHSGCVVSKQVTNELTTTLNNMSLTNNTNANNTNNILSTTTGNQQDALSLSLLSALETAFASGNGFGDDDDNDGMGIGPVSNNTNLVTSNNSLYTKAVSSIYIHPTVTNALTHILQFITTCTQNHNLYSRGLLDEACSLVLAFLRTTYRMYSKNVDLDALQHIASNGTYGGASPSGTGNNKNNLFNLLDNNDSDIDNEKENNNNDESQDNESPTLQNDKKTIIFPLPYNNSSYISCLTAIVSLCTRLTESVLSSTTLRHSTGYLDNLDIIPEYLIMLLKDLMAHMFSIPIDILLTHRDLISSYLLLLSELFGVLLPLSMVHFNIDIIIHNLYICLRVIEAYHHINVSHPMYNNLRIAAEAFLSVLQYEPKNIAFVELTNHDILYHTSQNHIASSYYVHLMNSLINGGEHAIQQWPQIYQHQQLLNSTTNTSTSQTFPITNHTNPQQQQQQSMLFNTSTLNNDQHALLSVSSYMQTHTTREIIPDNFVNFYTLPRQLDSSIVQDGTNMNHITEMSIQQQQELLNKKNELKKKQTTQLLTFLNNTNHEIDIPIYDTIITHNINKEPYPLLRSTLSQHCNNVIKLILNRLNKIIPRFYQILWAIYNTVFFDGPDQAPPPIVKLLPYFIYFFPLIWKRFTEVLQQHVSPQLCNISKVEPSLVQTRIAQQCQVLSIWSKALVTGRREVPEGSDLAVLNLPTVNNGAALGTYSTTPSTQQYITYDINTLCDSSSSTVLRHLTRVITGLVNKPNF